MRSRLSAGGAGSAAAVGHDGGFGAARRWGHSTPPSSPRLGRCLARWSPAPGDGTLVGDGSGAVRPRPIGPEATDERRRSSVQTRDGGRPTVLDDQPTGGVMRRTCSGHRSRRVRVALVEEVPGRRPSAPCRRGSRSRLGSWEHRIFAQTRIAGSLDHIRVISRLPGMTRRVRCPAPWCPSSLRSLDGTPPPTRGS